MKILIENYEIKSIKYVGVVENLSTCIEVFDNNTNEMIEFIIEGHNNIDKCVAYIYGKLLKEWREQND